MTQTAARYARVLWELNIPKEVIDETLCIYQQEPKLKQVLENPTVYIENKNLIVERIFPKQIQGFIKILCRYGNMEYLEECIMAYRIYANERNHILNVELRYVTLPDEIRMKGIKKFLCEKYGAEDIDLHIVQDPSLIGGFILTAKGQEYDWSLKGRISNLKEKLSRRRFIR